MTPLPCNHRVCSLDGAAYFAAVVAQLARLLPDFADKIRRCSCLRLPSALCFNPDHDAAFGALPRSAGLDCAARTWSSVLRFVRTVRGGVFAGQNNPGECLLALAARIWIRQRASADFSQLAIEFDEAPTYSCVSHPEHLHSECR